MKQTAFAGPKQSSAFRNNYVAAFLIVAALFLSDSLMAQAPSRNGLNTVNTIGNNNRNGAYRGVLYIPQDTVQTADSGAVAFLNAVLYQKNTDYWRPVGKATQLTDSSFIVGSDTIVIRQTTFTEGSVPFAGSDGTLQEDNTAFRYDSTNIGLTIRRDNIGATPSLTTGLLLENKQAAADGAQQYSPGIWFKGQGWRTTTGGSSREVMYHVYLRPAQATANPDGDLIFHRYTDGVPTNTPGFSIENEGIRVHTGLLSGSGGISLNANSTPVKDRITIGARLTFWSNVLASPGNTYTFFTPQVVHTSGEINHIIDSSVFFPVSGTGEYNGFVFRSRIAQTGTASGISRGLYIRPDIVSAADFRAIETTVGNNIFNSVSGNTLIGTTTDKGNNKRLQVSGSAFLGGSNTADTTHINSVLLMQSDSTVDRRDRFVVKTTGDENKNVQVLISARGGSTFPDVQIGTESAGISGIGFRLVDGGMGITPINGQTTMSIGGTAWKPATHHAMDLGSSNRAFSRVFTQRVLMGASGTMGDFMHTGITNRVFRWYYDSTNEAMRLNMNDGVKLGIATDSPTATLHVNGTGIISDTLTADRVVITNIDSSDTPNNLLFQVPNTGEIKKTSVTGFARTINGSTTHDFGTIANNSSATTTVALTGAADGDFVLVTKPISDGWSNGESYTGWVSAPGEVTVRQNNNSGGSASFGTQNINVKVIKQ